MSLATRQVSISEAQAPWELAIVRQLFEEYAAELGHDLCFQGFAQELGSLPGSYARPDGRLLLASAGDEIGGCVGLRRLEQDICEMKRLFVRPPFRRLGAGRLLADRIVAEARSAGYRRMRLDTLTSMESALTLYRRLGFREIAPYRDNPIPGAVYMELELNEPTLET